MENWETQRKMIGREWRWILKILRTVAKGDSIGGNDGSRSDEVSNQAVDYPDARKYCHEEAIESEHVENNSEIYGSELQREAVDSVSCEHSQQQARITPLAGKSPHVESVIIGLRLVRSAHHPGKASNAESEVILPETSNPSQPEPAGASDENEKTIST